MKLLKLRKQIIQSHDWTIFKTFISQNYWTFFIGLFFSMLAVGVNIGAVFLLRNITAGINPSSFNGDLNLQAGVLVLIYVLGLGFSLTSSQVMVYLSNVIGMKIRSTVFHKLQRLPLKYFEVNSTGNLMTKLTTDVNNLVNNFASNVNNLINAIFISIGMLVGMFVVSSYLTLIILIFFPPMIYRIVYLIKKSQPIMGINVNLIGKLSELSEELFSGQKTINSFEQQKYVEARFAQYNKLIQKYYKKQMGYSGLIFPWSNFMSNFILLLVTLISIVFAITKVGFGGVFDANLLAVSNNTTTYITQYVAIIAVFSLMLRNFNAPINSLFNLMNAFQIAVSSAKRVFSVFDEEDEFKSHEVWNLAINTHHESSTKFIDHIRYSEYNQPVSLKNVALIKNLTHTQTCVPVGNYAAQGNITINNLNFAYNQNKPVLKQISLDIKKGQKIAIVGPTGSGKSTFISILTKFYDVEDGDLYFDEISIKKLTKASVRKNVSIVLQENIIFNDTIYNNLLYGNLSATKDEVIAAAKAAFAHDFIMKLENGYETVIEDFGASFSQGQKQLLTIARVILSPSEILIFDEATSSIDTKTESHIQKAMLSLMQNKTAFIIAHRLSTIKDADLILFLQDGVIVEKGTHQQLLKNHGFYTNFYNSQFE